jgi:hypothetical protein
MKARAQCWKWLSRRRKEEELAGSRCRCARRAGANSAQKPETRRTRVSTISGMCLLSLWGALTCAVAAPPEWTAELLESPAGSRGPTDPIRVRLPVLPRATVQQLALELDDLDVSAMATIEGRELVFAPPQPLAFGTHQLRLVQNAADGNIREVAVWGIDIRKTAAFREASLQSNIKLGANERIAERNLAEPKPSTFQADGAAQLQAALANGAWRTTGQMDLLYNSQKGLMPRGENGTYVDVTTFLLTYEQGPVIAQAGRHGAAPDSLILSGFQRRGVSVGAQSRDVGLGATAFSLRTQDAVGFVDGLGIGDSNNLTNGIVLSARPIRTRPETLAVTATYLSGKDPGQSAVGSGSDSSSTVATQGRAADIVADSQLLQQRLRLRGEYAATRFDLDGAGSDTNGDGAIDSNLDPKRDHAYAVLLSFVPWREKLVDNKPLVWSLGVENRRIGTFFKSPANPTGIADRDMIRAFSAINWSGLDAQLSLGRETDNVDDLDLVPRARTGQRFASLAYTPQINRQPQPDGRLPAQPWYGQPTFNASYSGVSRDIEKAGASLSTGPLSDSSALLFGASFSYPTWNWSANYTIAAIQDHTGNAPDTDTDVVGLNANIRFAERLTLSPMIQYSKTKQSDPPAGLAATDTVTTTASVAIGYLFSERLSGLLQYNLNRTDTSCGCQDMRSADITGNLTWMQVPAQGSKPGISYSLYGQYHDAEDRTIVINPPSTYQIFLRIEMNWAPSL